MIFLCDGEERGMSCDSVVLGYIYMIFSRYIHTDKHTVTGFEQIVLSCGLTVLTEVG